MSYMQCDCSLLSNKYSTVGAFCVFAIVTSYFFCIQHNNLCSTFCQHSFDYYSNVLTALKSYFILLYLKEPCSTIDLGMCHYVSFILPQIWRSLNWTSPTYEEKLTQWTLTYSLNSTELCLSSIGGTNCTYVVIVLCKWYIPGIRFAVCTSVTILITVQCEETCFHFRKVFWPVVLEVVLDVPQNDRELVTNGQI